MAAKRKRKTERAVKRGTPDRTTVVTPAQLEAAAKDPSLTTLQRRAAEALAQRARFIQDGPPPGPTSTIERDIPPERPPGEPPWGGVAAHEKVPGLHSDVALLAWIEKLAATIEDQKADIEALAKVHGERLDGHDVRLDTESHRLTRVALRVDHHESRLNTDAGAGNPD